MAEQAIFQGASAIKFIQALQKKVKDVAGAQEAFADMLGPTVYADITRHFENEEGSKGPWKAWSDAYTAHRVAIGRVQGPILHMTGRLKGSFLPGNYRTERGGILWFNPAKTEGGGFPYAYAHDEGGPKLPKRDFMWLSGNAMKLIEKITIGFILGEK